MDLGVYFTGLRYTVDSLRMTVWGQAVGLKDLWFRAWG